MIKLLKAGQLIDGLGNPPLSNAAVLVEGDRIKAVMANPPDDLGFPVETLDFPGGTLLPGLIDAHVHVTIDPTCYDTPAFLAAATEAQLYEIGKRQVRQFLEAGVTTVRDLGARELVSLRIRDDVAAQRITGARVLAAGPVITTVKGHGYFNGVEVANNAEMAAVIVKLIAGGVDVIKLIGTGGGVTPGSDPTQPQFDSVALQLAVDTAHRGGRRVAVHAHSATGIRNCLEAGVDTIEHCTFVTPRGVESDTRLIGQLAERQVHVVPTLGPWYVLRDSSDPFLGFPQFGFSPQFMCDKVLANLDLMRRAGVKLVTGTDAGTWRLSPDKFYDEMEGFTQAGFSPLESIAAATGVAADALGLSAEVGSVQVGKQADLIVVPGDPTRTFSVLSQPRLVMKGGEVCFQKPVDGQT